jgi:hypothetical protein
MYWVMLVIHIYIASPALQGQLTYEGQGVEFSVNPSQHHGDDDSDDNGGCTSSSSSSSL